MLWLLFVASIHSRVVELESEAQLHRLLSADAPATEVPTAFVEAYAPWCQHCRQFAPHWDEFGRAMASLRPTTRVSVAKVDATLPPVADWMRRLDVHAFPSFALVRLLHNSSAVVTPYRGLRAVDHLSAFAVRHANKSPVVTLPSADEVTAFLASTPVDTVRLVLLVRDDEVAAPAAALLRHSFERAAALFVAHTAFGIAPLSLGPSGAAELLAANPATVAVAWVLSQDEPALELVADAGDEAVGDVVRRNRFDALPCGSNGRLSELVRGITVLVALVAPAPRPTAERPAADAEFGRQVAALAELARAVRRSTAGVQFAYVDASDAAHARWLGVVGVELPVAEAKLVVVRVGSGVVHRAPLSQLVSAGDLNAWIRSVSDDDDDNNSNAADVAGAEMGFAGSGELYIRHMFGYHWRKRALAIVAGGVVATAVALFLAYRFVVRRPPPRDGGDDDSSDDDDAALAAAAAAASRKPRVIDMSNAPGNGTIPTAHAKND